MNLMSCHKFINKLQPKHHISRLNILNFKKLKKLL